MTTTLAQNAQFHATFEGTNMVDLYKDFTVQPGSNPPSSLVQLRPAGMTSEGHIELQL